MVIMEHKTQNFTTWLHDLFQILISFIIIKIGTSGFYGENNAKTHIFVKDRLVFTGKFCTKFLPLSVKL
jgi:hypothetical protein